jgi:hypothetical protein
MAPKKMKLSTLISELQDKLKEHGDVVVNMWTGENEDTVEIAGLAVCEDDEGKDVTITVCDRGTLEAFG